MACRCSVCGSSVDCYDGACPVCGIPDQCTDGVHCEVIIREVKPEVFLVQKEDKTYGLKWIPKEQPAPKD